MRLEAASAAHLDWLRTKTGCALTPQAQGLAVLDASNVLRGVVAFDGHTPAAVWCHIALETPAALRPLLREGFPYVFQHRAVLLGMLPEHRRAARAFAARLGFRLVSRVSDGWAPGEALLVYELRREACRWIRRTGADRQDRKAA